jgi:hypothetical protein
MLRARHGLWRRSRNVMMTPLPPKRKYQKFAEVQSDDAAIRQKAEIPRTTRQQPQRKRTFCQLCDDHTQWFQGEHELRRHVHHTTYRKVWICKSNTSTDGRRPAVPPSSCKACHTSKTYGANYNAAARPRRMHFFTCKNKRGGRGKVSEGRGGMGDGEKPTMDGLKNWMSTKQRSVSQAALCKVPLPELSQNSRIEVSGNKVGDKSNQRIANALGRVEGATATVEVSNNQAETQSNQHIANASEPEWKLA